MRHVFLAVLGISLRALSVVPQGQSVTPPSGAPQYLMIDVVSTGTLQRELVAAGREGFEIIASSNLCVLLKRTDSGPRGKRLNPDSFSALSFKNPTPIVIVERGAPLSEADAGARDYRVVSTMKTSTLEKEVIQAASEGFRIIGWGYMTVVMEKTKGETPPAEFNVIAATRLATAERELRQAGEEGYRLIATPDSANETICVLQRTPHRAERYAYMVAALTEKDVDERMRSAMTDQYRLAALILGRLGIFEKPVTP